MITTALFSFFTVILLFPLALIFMQGPSVSAELALGTILATAGLYFFKRMRDIKRVAPYFVVMFVYIAGAFYWKDRDNDLTARYVLGLLCYLLPAGLLLREFVCRGRGNAVLLGIALFSLAVAAAGLVVLRTVGVENLVKAAGLGFSRGNVENETFSYLSRISQIGMTDAELT